MDFMIIFLYFSVIIILDINTSVCQFSFTR